MKTCVLFCESHLQQNRVDEDFEDQFIAAQENSFETLLLSFEDLTGTNDFKKATKRIPPRELLTNVIYRGWMLTPAQYAVLYTDLLRKNYKLLNTIEEYQNCHYLPHSLKFIESHTPGTVFQKFAGRESINEIIEKSRVFGSAPVILKDYVKSEKHDWETACFIPDASDRDHFRQVIHNTSSNFGVPI